MRVGSLVKRHAPQGAHTMFGLVLQLIHGKTFSEVLVVWLGSTDRKKMYKQWIAPGFLEDIES